MYTIHKDPNESQFKNFAGKAIKEGKKVNQRRRNRFGKADEGKERSKGLHMGQNVVTV